MEREFNREVKAGFLFLFLFLFLSESRCLEGFSYLPHSRQSFFLLKGFNAMVSVCLSVSGFL